MQTIKIVLTGQMSHSVDADGGSFGEHEAAGAGNDERVSRVLLALRTLADFDFSGQSLTIIVERCAKQFLLSDVTEIRLAAATTCCALLIPMISVCTASASHFFDESCAHSHDISQ